MKVVINPKYNFLTNFIYHIPGCFFKEGETIYQGRNILKKYDIQGYRLIVKRFKRPNIINQIVYSFFVDRKHDALLTIRLKFRSVDLELQILLHILR